MDIALPHEQEADGQTVSRAKRILVNLGFDQDAFARHARELSGGWIMRAHLARLLVTEPELLMLDEPTNHLDLETVLWLQSHLENYTGGMLLISHDREFLNRLCTHVVEIRQGRVLRYTGNYDAYLLQREAAEETRLATHKAQTREIDRLQTFVDRFRAKNTKAAQAQSKLKQIERLRAVMVDGSADTEATVGFRFPQPHRSGHRVITLENVKFGYPPQDSRGSRVEGREQGTLTPSLSHRMGEGARLVRRRLGEGGRAGEGPGVSGPALAGPGEGPHAPAHPAPHASQPEHHPAIPEKLIYQHLNFSAERGQRIVLVGPNGAGKSTLLKLLAHQLKPQAGERELGHNVKAGYYAQHRLAMLDASRTVLEEALETPQRVSEQFVRTVLRSFLFRGDDVFKSVSILSGGEKSRLALVKLLLDPPNLLLMDEPTTHLDLASVDALIEALKPFEGTLVFISHDVHFIRALATHVVRVENGVLKHFPGGYDYYLDKTAQSARAGLTGGMESAVATKAARKPAGVMPDRKVEKRKEAELRQARSRQKREIQERIAGLEKEIADLESRQKELVAQLESPDTYAKPGRAMEVNRELMDIHDRLALVMSNWEKASTEMAGMENGAIC